MTPDDEWRDELSEIRRRAGRLGGRVKAMRYAGRQRDGTEAARAAFRQPFEEGKHYCRLCRDRAQFDPTGLLPEQRAKAADHALNFHMAQMRIAKAHRDGTP